MIYMHLYGPNPIGRMWFLASLAAAITATISARLDQRGPQVPLGASYDLGWQQGYRTAAAEYLGLIAQLRQQLNLKGYVHGKDQPPAEG